MTKEHQFVKQISEWKYHIEKPSQKAAEENDETYKENKTCGD